MIFFRGEVEINVHAGGTCSSWLPVSGAEDVQALSPGPSRNGDRIVNLSCRCSTSGFFGPRPRTLTVLRCGTESLATNTSLLFRNSDCL